MDFPNQIRKYAPILGLDPDGIRIIVTEAIQNIIEHGYGPYAEIALELNNLAAGSGSISHFEQNLQLQEKNITEPGSNGFVRYSFYWQQP